MRSLFIIILCWPVLALAADGWLGLSYHDVRDDVVEDLDADRYAVSTTQLTRHFEWLRRNGYTPISIDDISAAKQGGKPLPKGAVLLSFDDGLASAYEIVFPLLKQFNYPAVVAPVVSWTELKPDETVDYSDRRLGREAFLTVDQMRELSDSGLVEIASHSYNLHHGVPANPQGNTQPAAVTRIYDPDTGRYENDEAYENRIRADLAQSAEILKQVTGRAPRVIVWPYGAYNQVTEKIADSLGMSVSLGVREGFNPAGTLNRLNRFLISENPDLGLFVWYLPQPDRNWPIRVVQIDLDYVYDTDPEQQSLNLDALIERVHQLDITTVYLQAFADPDGDGTASELYFPNRHLPMRADLFNRVAWQLQTRADVEVFAWLPALAFELPDAERQARLMVKRPGPEGVPQPVTDTDHQRLSPFLPESRRIIREIYSDLSRYTPVQGLLFHDDAWLGSDEDISVHDPAAKPYLYRQINAGQRLTTNEKTLALTEWTETLADDVRIWRPQIKTARNLYAGTVLDPNIKEAFAQDLSLFAEHYDQVALMAMPWLERAEDAEAWLESLVSAVSKTPGALHKTIFELQAKDWHQDRWIDATVIADQMRLLQRKGIRHFGYYPDDFIEGRPDLEIIKRAISTNSFPYSRR